MLAVLLASVAVAAPWSDLVRTQPTASPTACAPDTGTQVARVPVRLVEAGLVYVEIGEWDAPVHVGLAQGKMVCHASFSTQGSASVEPGATRAEVRWLPAGIHHVELHAAEAASAVVAVSIVRTSDLVAMGMDAELAAAALHAADHAWTDGHAARSTLAVADFSLVSTTERFWVVDLADGALAHHLFVSHGKGSGSRTDARRAVHFSNRPNSNQTSPGLFRASETYVGDHGRSLRLDGLEPGINDLARDRAIVLHGADYARVEHIAEWGYLGRSHGCPAVDDRVAQALIDDLHDGGLLYVRGRPEELSCCTLRSRTETSPAAPYLPDPLGLVSIY